MVETPIYESSYRRVRLRYVLAVLRILILPYSTFAGGPRNNCKLTSETGPTTLRGLRSRLPWTGRVLFVSVCRFTFIPIRRTGRFLLRQICLLAGRGNKLGRLGWGEGNPGE